MCKLPASSGVWSYLLIFKAEQYWLSPTTCVWWCRSARSKDDEILPAHSPLPPPPQKKTSPDYMWDQSNVCRGVWNTVEMQRDSIALEGGETGAGAWVWQLEEAEKLTVLRAHQLCLGDWNPNINLCRCCCCLLKFHFYHVLPWMNQQQSKMGKWDNEQELLMEEIIVAKSQHLPLLILLLPDFCWIQHRSLNTQA